MSMEDFFDLNNEYIDDVTETELILNIDLASEMQFLENIGGASARERDIVAFVDQYAATGITALCFPLANKKFLAICCDRCRKVGLKSYLLISSETASEFDDYCDISVDKILLDDRTVTDLTCFDVIKNNIPSEKLALLTADKAVAQDECYDMIVVCPAEDNCRVAVSDDWLANRNEHMIVPCVNNYLCSANEKNWHPTPEIMNGIAVQYLAKGYDGLFLDGFCADPFDADGNLYDIYDTCGNLAEAVGARRRHLYTGELPVSIQANDDWKVEMHLGPVFAGAAVCVLIAAAVENSFDVFVGEKKLEKTGTPVLSAIDDSGRERQIGFIAKSSKCSEFFVSIGDDCDSLSLCIKNKSDKNVTISWLEISVNV